MMQRSILSQAIPQETQVVEHDAFDKDTFLSMKDNAQALLDAQEKGTRELNTFPPLMQDMFNSLYKYSPKVREPNQLKSSHRFNHSLVNKATETDQYNHLRQYTKLDEVNSALATVTIANKLTETIKTELKEQAEEANKLAQQEVTCQNACDKADSLLDIAKKARGTPQAKDLQDKANQAQAKAGTTQKKLEKMQAQAEKNMAGSQQKIRQAMRSAELDAIRDVKETSELMEAWGTEPGQLTQLPAEQRLELAQKLAGKDKLKKLAGMLGRFRRMAIHSQKTKINHGLDEVHDMETGSDLEKVLPSELVNLRHPLLKKQFQRKFTEGQLLQYQLRGREKAGKGPIVCCVDSSGSMGGDNELWAKAVALALLEIAQMQKRAFAVIFFGSESDPLEIIEVHKGEQNIIDKVIQIAEYFLNGGTDFEKPLNAAIELIEKTEFKKADIVFVTDGHCGVSDEWLQEFVRRKAEKETRIHSVLVEMVQSNETVDSFSDQVSTVMDLTVDSAVEIFQGV
ncbi:MAG: VWA domain-containing protein [Methanosarcinales archaeon]|nr:VWA domain-containing protein [Methanosarcinales archaeon]